MESKECTKCNVVKPLEEYSLRKTGRVESYCRGCVRAANRKSYQKHKKARNKAVLEWVRDNTDKVEAYWEKRKVEGLTNLYMRERKAKDPLFKFTCSTRVLICNTFKNACEGRHVKRSKTFDILGCDTEFFVSYISEQFVEGMTLGNHGEWHLDHIIPISTAKTEEDIIRLNHYTNFQPLWAADNFRKGTKLNWKIT